MNLFERVTREPTKGFGWGEHFRNIKAARLYKVVGDFHNPFFTRGDLFLVSPNIKPGLRSKVAVTVQGRGQVLGILLDRHDGKVIIRVLNYANSVHAINESSIISMQRIVAGFHQ